MNSFGSPPSPFGQSLTGSPNMGQQPQQQSNPFMGGQGFGGGFQPQQQSNPFMSTQGGYGGFGAGMQGGDSFGSGSNYQMPAYAQSYIGNTGMMQGYGGDNGQYQDMPAQPQGGFGGYGGYGGYNGQMQGGFGGGFGGFGGFGGPMQGGFGGPMQNPFMGGYGGPPQRGFGGGYGRDRGFGGGYGRDRGQQQYQQPQFQPQPQVMPQQPAFLQDQEFQGYRQQADDLSKHMNEYMQKAPMYQQLQDLQGKMRGVEGRYAPQNSYAPPPPDILAQQSFQQAGQSQQEAMRRAQAPAFAQPQQMPYDPTGGAPRQAPFGAGSMQGGFGGLATLLRGNLGTLGAGLYGGTPQRQSYEQYLAGRSPYQSDVQQTREQYESPVQQQVNPEAFR